jgi:hypothetical protein
MPAVPVPMPEVWVILWIAKAYALEAEKQLQR